MLTFEHVSFSYSREADTVRDLSFSVGDGEFVALIGSNEPENPRSAAWRMAFSIHRAGECWWTGRILPW